MTVECFYSLEQIKIFPSKIIIYSIVCNIPIYTVKKLNMATIFSIILDISNQQYEFKVYENVCDCNLCNIKRRKYDFGNYILNGILIKKLQIGGHFAKK